MKLSSISGLVAIAIAVPIHASVVARVEGEITDAPAKWLSVETGICEHPETGKKANNVDSFAQRTETILLPWYPAPEQADRAPITSVIDDWCGKVIGTTVNNGQTVWARYDYGTFTVLVSGEAING
ncbi:hypothetical protein C8R45DRAFT_922921 [Mycena sanguinolenta]|nr:hypothetical protein C8R45DRAFT_922921 [Mycena sanguinolenta]